MPETIISGIASLLEFFLFRDAADLIEVAGPQIGMAIIFFLGIIALIVMIWRSISAERRMRLEFNDRRESNAARLAIAKQELEASRQKTDAQESSSLHKLLEKMVDAQTNYQEMQAEQIRSRNDLQTMIKGLHTKTENFGNWMALASESTEAFQAWARGSVAAAEQRGIETKQMLEPVPVKLETILEATTDAKTAAKSAEREIKTVGANVTDAISKLTAIENILHTIETSVGNMKAALLNSTAAADMPPSIEQLVKEITEPIKVEAAVQIVAAPETETKPEA